MEYFSTLFNQFTIKDLIDIFIVSVLFYQILSIIRGTRAVQVLVGVAVLSALYWIGITYDLFALNWLLDHLFSSFLILLIIIFQEEFKAALAKFGSGGHMFDNAKKDETIVELTEIIESLRLLSREKIGAIIVIENHQGLLNFIRSGTKLNSNLHSDLIYSIFQSKSALHDGAIIVSGGKIAAAGCFLPLSNSLGIDRNLGTRHRAALGLSELTDALILTVSEEKGTISLWKNGEREVYEELSLLFNRLKSILSRNKKNSKVIKKQLMAGK
ncbi:MAG: TIGR00159 family protein [Halobacteriovoraceae bacterium]|nr:TIGR00159 family protein [Halobacteriovoraceae bacterium]